METSTIVILVIVLVVLGFLLWYFMGNTSSCTSSITDLHVDQDSLVWEFPTSNETQEFIIRSFRSDEDFKKNQAVSSVTTKHFSSPARKTIVTGTKVATVALKSCPNDASVISY